MKALRLFSVVVCFGMFFFAVSAQAALLTNGGFETPVLPGASFTEYGAGANPVPGGFGWTVPINNVDVWSNGVAGWNTQAPDGVQGLDLVGGGSTGEIQQSFVTTVGQLYALSFFYSNSPLNGTDSAEVTVTGGGTVLDQTVSHSGATPSAFNWQYAYYTFTAASASSTITFNETVGSANGGVWLDGVVINPTPEPFTGLLVLGGLAGLAMIRRRQKA